MAKFRKVYADFWNDPRVNEEMTAEDRYFFLYLLTNPQSTQCGIYQITKKQAAFDMGYSAESMNSLFDRFENHHKLIKYNKETREIAVKNWGKYNLNRGGKPILDCVKAELLRVKDIELVSYVKDGVENESIKELFKAAEDGVLREFSTSKKTTNDTSDDTLHDTSDDTLHDASTYRGQEKEKEKEKEKEEEQEQQQEKEKPESSSGGGSGLVYEFYSQNFGLLTPFIAESIDEWITDIGEPLTLEAMKNAAKSGKNFKYAEGIMKNWKRNNIKTLEDVEAEQLKHERETSSAPPGNLEGLTGEEFKRAIGRTSYS